MTWFNLDYTCPSLTLLLVLQIFNEISARKPEKVNCFEGFFKNRMFLGIIFITVGLQVCFLPRLLQAVLLDKVILFHISSI
jgi:hypothetical protein